MTAWLAFLAGCATSSPYVPPADGPMARLLLRSQNLVRGNYVVDTFDDSQRCRGPRNILETTSGTIDSATSIPAGQPVSLRIFCSFNGRWANYIVTFDAKSGHKYDVEPFSDKDYCGMVVFDATSGERVLEPSARRRELSSHIDGSLCSSTESFPVVVDKRNDRLKLDDLTGLIPDLKDKATPSRQGNPPKSNRSLLEDISDLLPDSERKETISRKPNDSKENQGTIDDLHDLLPKTERQ